MISEPVISRLSSIVGNGRASTGREVLKAYSYDGTTNWVSEPDAVLFPSTAEEISAIMKIANAERIPVTPRGAGTCLSGGPVPIRNGIVLCTINMKDIIGVDKENRTATVEPGVVLMDLNTVLGRDGLFFPPDPQSFLSATIAGMIAEKAMDEIFSSAIDLGGVISGEHGIGLEKQRYLKRGIEPAVIDMMKNIKAIFDPNNIMNPGKIWE